MKENKKMKTLFIGDVNVDLIFGGLQSPVLEDKEVTASSFDVTMGSSAIITATTFSSLGGNAKSCGLAGNDEYGQFMINSLKEFNIDTEMIDLDSSISTGITVNLIHKSTRSQVTYLGGIDKFTGPNLTLNYDCISHAHLSGIYQQTSFLPNIRETLSLLKNKGITTSLDTQWDMSEKWDYLDELLPLIDILFVNKDEAASIAKSENLDKIISYFKNKSDLVVVKLGSQGSLIISEDDSLQIPPFKVDVVDTTGAGDTFAGAFLYALNNCNKTLFESGLFASAAAARSCQFIGGVNAKTTVKDIDKLLEKYNAN